METNELKTLRVKKTTIVRLSGRPDKISFWIEGPNPFPNFIDSVACVNIDVARGTAEDWLNKLGFNIDNVELVEATI